MIAHDSAHDTNRVSGISVLCRETYKYTSYTYLRDDTAMASRYCRDGSGPVSRQYTASLSVRKADNRESRLKAVATVFGRCGSGSSVSVETTEETNG